MVSHLLSSNLAVHGVRQGCPLSGLLFVLAIELLGNAIRKAKDKKGIDVDSRDIKLSQYADDTTVSVADIFSAQKLKKILLLFSKCSGLTLNPSKSDALCLGSLRNSEEQVLNFRKSEATVYGLGVHFSYKSDVANVKNFYQKLDSIKQFLNMWRTRDLSLLGKIQIVRSLALSKLTFVSSVLPCPPEFSKEVDRITFSFIWNGKPPKIKKCTIISCI